MLWHKCFSYIDLHWDLQSISFEVLTCFGFSDLQIISKACDLLKVFDQAWIVEVYLWLIRGNEFLKVVARHGLLFMVQVIFFKAYELKHVLV